MSEINGYGTEENYGEVFPGWDLVRLVNKTSKYSYIINGFEMKEKSWGLTQSNDPSFVFDMNPMKDNMFGLPDEDCPDEPEGYYDVLRHYEERLSGDCVDSYYLVKAAIESGWDINKGGFACYISHKIWETLERCNWTPLYTYD